VTVIAGLVHKGRAYLAADRLVSNGADHYYTIKLARFGNWAMGFSGDSWPAELIGRDSTFAEKQKTADPFDLALAARDVLTEAGYERQDEKGKPIQYSTWALLAHSSGRLFELFPDFYPHEIATFAATGAGGRTAQGADWAGRRHLSDPASRLHRAVSAACALSPDCAGPVDIWEVGGTWRKQSLRAQHARARVRP